MAGIYLWDKQANSKSRPHRRIAHTGKPVTHLAVSPDSHFVITCCEESSVAEIWSKEGVREKDGVLELPTAARRIEAEKYLKGVAWQEGDRGVITFDGFFGLRNWNPTTGEALPAVVTASAAPQGFAAFGSRIAAFRER